MEVILNKALTSSRLSYLRALQLCHAQTSTLVNDLKGKDPAFVAFRAESFSAGSSQFVVPSSQSLTGMLETAMEELFATYIEGQRALEIEVISLGELYSTYLDRFTRFHVR